MTIPTVSIPMLQTASEFSDALRNLLTMHDEQNVADDILGDDDHFSPSMYRENLDRI